ncbi:MAG: acyl-CoA synthetase [Pseudomonadota bacterium]
MSELPLIKTQQDIENIEQVPWRDYCPEISTYDVIRRSAKQFTDLPALLFLPSGSADEQPHAVSFNELLSRVTQTANLLHSLGVGAADVVSYILPNLPETHDVIWGAETAGIVNAVNPLLEPATIAQLLAAAQSRIIVTTPPLPGLNLWDPVVAVADQLEHVTTVLCVDPSAYFGLPPAELPAKTPKGKPILHFQDARDGQPGDELVFSRDVRPADIASLFHTGGTTGIPKLAPHTHENEVFNAWLISRITRLEAGDKAVVGLPLFHVNAVITTGLASFFSGVAQLMLGPMGFRGPGVVENLWRVIARHKAASMSGVPTIYGALMSIPKDGLDLSAFKFAAVGAAPLSPDLFRNFVDYSGVELLEGYGLTESTVVATTNPLGGEKRVGSIGLRLPYLQIRCAELDEQGEVQRFCDVDEIGTVVIRGPSVFPGYYQHAESGLSTDGWLNTGDLGRQDADGYFWLTGRSKDVIIRSGHNIDPGSIENTLEEHDAIALAAAIGQPDEYAGELPAAYIQLQPGAQVDVDELQAWAKSRIPERAAAPVYLEVLESLPVTAVGKIHKPPLREMATRRVVADRLRQAGLDAEVSVLNDSHRGLVAVIHSAESDTIRTLVENFALAIEFRP